MLISTGEMISPFPAHTARYWARPDLAWRPMRDLRPMSYAMVWRTDTENETIRDLADVVRDLGALQPA